MCALHPLGRTGDTFKVFIGKVPRFFRAPRRRIYGSYLTVRKCLAAAELLRYACYRQVNAELEYNRALHPPPSEKREIRQTQEPESGLCQLGLPQGTGRFRTYPDAPARRGL